MSLTVELFNGSRTKEAWNEDSPEFIDDWKPETRRIDTVAFYQETYGSDARFVMEDATELRLQWTSEGFIEYDGIYFGDFRIIEGGAS